MRYLVTGVTGQLGAEVAAKLLARGETVFGSGRKQEAPKELTAQPGFTYLAFDLADDTAVKTAFGAALPDAVIHCASWTAVDEAEKKENRDLVTKINAGSTRLLAGLCAAHGAKLLYISTDYVFGGTGEKPYGADSEDFDPLNVYGATKLEGERAVRETLAEHFVVRVSWTFGKYGDNFVEKMLRVAQGRQEVSVVDDQFGTPTYTSDAASVICDIAESSEYGTYNLAASGGFVSRAGFAREIFRAAGIDVRVVPVKTADFKSPAKRPLNSRFDCSKLGLHGFSALPDWKDGLARYLAERKEP